MRVISFKFKNQKTWHRLQFDEPYVALRDVRRQIYAVSKLNAHKNRLVVSNVELGLVYTQDDYCFARDVTLLVRVVPVSVGNEPDTPKVEVETEVLQPCATDDLFGPDIFESEDKPQKTDEEERKMCAVVQQAHGYLSYRNKTAVYAPSDKTDKGASFGSPRLNENGSHVLHRDARGERTSQLREREGRSLPPPPSNYVCHRCGQPGHWIKYCPTNGDESFDAKNRQPLRPPVGIPRSFLQRISKEEAERAPQSDQEEQQRSGGTLKLETHEGSQFFVAKPNSRAFRKFFEREDGPATKRARGRSAQSSAQSSAQPLDQLFDSRHLLLLCGFCGHVCREAVAMRCCHTSFCDECLRQFLVGADRGMCPVCPTLLSDESPAVPNVGLRALIQARGGSELSPAASPDVKGDACNLRRRTVH